MDGRHTRKNHPGGRAVQCFRFVLRGRFDLGGYKIGGSDYTGGGGIDHERGRVVDAGGVVCRSDAGAAMLRVYGFVHCA